MRGRIIWIVLETLCLMFCLIVLPVLFHWEEQDYTPSAMEQSQQMQPVIPEEKKEETEQQEAEQTDWEPFRILNRTTGEIETVPVKEYVTGALCSEMPATFDSEALKAQAVSAHTWALYCQQAAKQSGQAYDFSADPQNWQGYVTEEQAKERFGDYFTEYWTKISRAAEEVWQEIMVDSQNQPIVAAYHAISSGTTESAENVWGNELSYLVPVDSSGDIHAQGYQKTVTFSKDELKKLLETYQPMPNLSQDPSEWLSILERSGSGYVTLMRMGDAQMSGIEFRELLGLRSSDFDFSFDGETFTFTTTGYGHGVGLSQYGADYLARQGKTYQEILEHYYSGATLVERA